MKKPIILTIGTMLILVVLGVWVYLLLFGTPQNTSEVFSNFGIGGTTERPLIEEQPSLPTEIDTTRIDTQTGALRQLTTRSVAGFTFIGTSTDRIRYVERGTGHVYEINIITGEETRVSATTIARVVEATFSADSTHVTLTSENGNAHEITVGTIGTGAVLENTIALPPGAFEPHFRSNSTIVYLQTGAGGTEGYELNLAESEPLRLFTTPFQSIRAVWNPSSTYVYNRPTALLEGALYEITSTSLVPHTPTAFGFTGTVGTTYTIWTQNDSGQVISHAFHNESGNQYRLALPYIPEKCVESSVSPDRFWCAAPIDPLQSNFLEEWYKGTITSEDMLWSMRIPEEQSALATNLVRESGRIIDVASIKVSSDDSLLLFSNKIDGALWLYDTKTE